MKRVKKSLRAYQLLSSAFTAAIVVAAVALLSVAGASDAGNLTDAELFKSLSVVSGGFAIAYLGKHICTKNIQALERRIDRYIERRGMVDTFTMSSGVRMAHFELSVPKGKETVRTGRGTDNPEHAKDIILAMTADKDNLLKISKDYSDFTNTKSGMAEAATDDANFSSEFLGGQNPFTYFAPVAENIKIAPLSAYDQGCVELIQNSFSDYFQGNVDFDKAKANFETAIKERYPEISEVKWPE